MPIHSDILISWYLNDTPWYSYILSPGTQKCMPIHGDILILWYLTDTPVRPSPLDQPDPFAGLDEAFSLTTSDSFHCLPTLPPSLINISNPLIMIIKFCIAMSDSVHLFWWCCNWTLNSASVGNFIVINTISIFLLKHLLNAGISNDHTRRMPLYLQIYVTRSLGALWAPNF